MKVKVQSMKESKSLKEWFSEKDFRAMSPEEHEQKKSHNQVNREGA